MSKQSSITLMPWVSDHIDGLLSKTELDELFMSVNTPSVYSFMGKSNPDDAFGFWLAKLDTDIVQSIPAFNGLAEKVDKYFIQGKYRIYQMIINANTYGDCTTIHTDIDPENADQEGYYTILCYANNYWEPDWAGETVLYTQERDDIIKSIYPRPGRIAVFDSRIPHASRAVSRLCDKVRYTVAIKLVKK